MKKRSQNSVGFIFFFSVDPVRAQTEACSRVMGDGV